MKLSITKAELTRGLARIQAIVEKRNSMPNSTWLPQKIDCLTVRSTIFAFST